jgi:hypothetical protein
MQIIADSTHGQFALLQQSNHQSQRIQLSVIIIVLQQPPHKQHVPWYDDRPCITCSSAFLNNWAAAWTVSTEIVVLTHSQVTSGPVPRRGIQRQVFSGRGVEVPVCKKAPLSHCRHLIARTVHHHKYPLEVSNGHRSVGHSERFRKKAVMLVCGRTDRIFSVQQKHRVQFL